AGACTLCGECVEVCPVHAIVLGDEAAGIGEACIGCGLCARTCSSGAIALYETRPSGHIPS
ncbi:MAG TPA: 4Fe-4S binding protein, partial [Spirochaetota bacterium]|nr:4Fe-4S binding protein [Spirochaetota bacterium]HPV98556.1 4Fe-4S binding protein [Spirochaetota bacterium]